MLQQRTAHALRLRLVTAIIATLTTAVAITPTLPAAASGPRQPLARLLVELWTDILEAPAAGNPYVTGGCFEIGPGDRIVSPFGAEGVDHCTVAPGTPLFVLAGAVENSDLEGAETPEERNQLARRFLENMTVHELWVDGRRVPVHAFVTAPFTFTLPADNLLGEPAGSVGISVGAGWGTLVPPLRPGEHTITIRTVVVDRTPADQTITTTITVAPRHST